MSLPVNPVTEPPVATAFPVAGSRRCCRAPSWQIRHRRLARHPRRYSRSRGRSPGCWRRPLRRPALGQRQGRRMDAVAGIGDRKGLDCVIFRRLPDAVRRGLGRGMRVDVRRPKARRAGGEAAGREPPSRWRSHRRCSRPSASRWRRRSPTARRHLPRRWPQRRRRWCSRPTCRSRRRRQAWRLHRRDAVGVGDQKIGRNDVRRVLIDARRRGRGQSRGLPGIAVRRRAAFGGQPWR